MDGPIAGQHARLERMLSGDGVVRRKPLFDQLSAAPPGGVATVSGPAGSGKTVLIRSWLEAEDLWPATAWVSVEPAERDAQRFWLAAIDALADAVESEELSSDSGPPPEFRGEPRSHACSRAGSLEKPLLLVIDDLHELRSAEALAWLERFLERLPSQLRLVLTTREELHLDLNDLRLSDALTEIRADDLRFTLDE